MESPAFRQFAARDERAEQAREDYRAIGSRGATIEFFLSAFRDKDAAKSLLRRSSRDGADRQPRVINMDLAATFSAAIPGLKRTLE